MSPFLLLAAIGLGPQSRDGVMVLAGGCFWGVEAVFEHVLGVRSVTSGFARPADAEKGFVPVEAVRIIYDPSRVKPDQLLSVFFTVAHDPSSRDAQGPDEGPEYRAMVFYQSASERTVAESSFTALSRAKSFPGPIMTEGMEGLIAADPRNAAVFGGVVRCFKESASQPPLPEA